MFTFDPVSVSILPVSCHLVLSKRATFISDYDKGFLDEDTINYIGKQHAVTFLDTKKQRKPRI